MTDATGTPWVLFVCVKNSGKSQMAAGLMTKMAGGSVQVHSAGTQPSAAVNDLSAQALAEVGVDITGNRPTLIDQRLVEDVERMRLVRDDITARVADLLDRIQAQSH